MKKTALFALGAIVFFTNCEKDDICDPNTPTTPHLVIDFYDVASINSNPTVLKNVSNLAVTGEGGSGVLLFDGVSQIKLPLKTTVDITKYHFVINSNDSIAKNEDELEFDYSRKDVYISRACGFKTLFTLKPNSPILTDSPSADGLWIQQKNITVVTPNINDENETHVKIYF